jgi:alpha-L-fucosidase 2
VIGTNDNLLEWDDDKTPAELGHRHLSHLYGLHPGTRITEIDTPEAFEAARTALYLRLDNGTGYTGWSQAWVLCLAARLGDRELAERSIGGMLDHLTSRSLLVLHPHTDWPGGNVFQIDGNFGVVAGLIELVVQSHGVAITLLKTLPPSWTTGSIRDIRCRGGHRASVSWRDGQLDQVALTIGASGPVTVDLPDGNWTIRDDTGTTVSATTAPSAQGRMRLTWPAVGAKRYTIRA